MWNCPTDFRLASPNNCMSQGLGINLLIDLSLGYYLCILLVLFLWRPLMDTEPQVRTQGQGQWEQQEMLFHSSLHCSNHKDLSSPQMYQAWSSCQTLAFAVSSHWKAPPVGTWMPCTATWSGSLLKCHIWWGGALPDYSNLKHPPPSSFFTQINFSSRQLPLLDILYISFVCLTHWNMSSWD